MQPSNQHDPYQSPPTPVVMQPTVSSAPPQLSPQPTTGYVGTFSSNEQVLRSIARRRLSMIIVAAILLLAAVGAAVWFLVNGHHNVAISSKVANVTMNADGLVPATVTVEKGQEVTITNADPVAHRLTADQSLLPSFDSIELLNQGDSYTYTFERSGTYHYYDPSNPTVFIGTVTVK